MDILQEACPCDQYHLIFGPGLWLVDSLIAPVITKMATEWDKLFNAFFLFQKLVKHNNIKLILVNWIETKLIILTIWIAFIIFIIARIITVYISGNGNSNKLVQRVLNPFLAKGPFGLPFSRWQKMVPIKMSTSRSSFEFYTHTTGLSRNIYPQSK